MIDDRLAADINAASRLSGTFKLRSGQLSDEYFDKYRFESDPKLLSRIARRMLPLIPQNTQILAGLELGGVPIATAISLESGLPTVFVRKKPKEYGTCQAVEGGDVRGRKVVIIEDVITTGGAVLDAARFIDEAGGQVIAIVCAIWRGEGSPGIKGLPALPVLPALTRDELSAATNYEARPQKQARFKNC
jgi:orotate phosphoribosyltransferase